jgi:putative membrane protein
MNPSTGKLSFRLGSAFAAASLCAVLMAQVEPTPTPEPTQVPAQGAAPGASALAHRDRSFLKKAAKGGMTEVAISEAVMDQLSDAGVKALAQQMIADHTAANAELASLAASKGVGLPPQDPDLVTDWSKKTDGVDAKYLKVMLSDHEDAVKLFKKGAESADPAIAAFAQKTLPVLEHHLMMVQDQIKKTG